MEQTLEQLKNVLDPLPLPEDLKTDLYNRLEEQGPTDELLEEAASLVDEVLQAVDQEQLVLAGEQIIVDEYTQRVEQAIEQAQHEREQAEVHINVMFDDMDNLLDQDDVAGARAALNAV